MVVLPSTGDAHHRLVVIRAWHPAAAGKFNTSSGARLCEGAMCLESATGASEIARDSAQIRRSSCGSHSMQTANERAVKFRTRNPGVKSVLSNAANPSGVCGAQANGRLRGLATGGGHCVCKKSTSLRFHSKP